MNTKEKFLPDNVLLKANEAVKLWCIGQGAKKFTAWMWKKTLLDKYLINYEIQMDENDGELIFVEVEIISNNDVVTKVRDYSDSIILIINVDGSINYEKNEWQYIDGSFDEYQDV